MSDLLSLWGLGLGTSQLPNMFKQHFKYYKSRKPPPDFRSVMDFNDLDPNKIRPICPKRMDIFFGLEPVSEWSMYEIINKPGLIFIKNPFTTIGQHYWITRTLKDYSKKPNQTNLDAQNMIPEDVDWWNYSQNNINANLLKKLRWATIGYHHNWDTKIYSDKMQSSFPNDLSLLCNYFSEVLGFKNFKAEAAIVNYYHMDSTLSGHTDHSEHNLEAPLFSFSFGQTAIFLIGGTNIDVKPIAMYIRSGDVLVMSKEARLAYHGIPRIIYTQDSIWDRISIGEDKKFEYIEKENLDICLDETLWEPFKHYLTFSRININVRQVLKEGQLTVS